MRVDGSQTCTVKTWFDGWIACAARRGEERSCHVFTVWKWDTNRIVIVFPRSAIHSPGEQRKKKSSLKSRRLTGVGIYNVPGFSFVSFSVPMGSFPEL